MNEKNQTPFHIAAQKNLKEMIELLQSKGADPNAEDFYFQNLIFLFFLKIFKRKGKKGRKKNKTPLSFFNYRSSEMLKVLESNKGNLMNSSKNFECKEVNNDIYKILLQTGGYIHARDVNLQIKISRCKLMG